MNLPIIFCIDDDEQVLKAITRDIKNRYRKNYRIISAQFANEALEALKEFKNRGETIALFLSDQRMPEMEGVEFLEKAQVMFPEAKRVLLTAYSDIEAAIKAINDVQLDFYLTKPWNPPEEKLYPTLDDLLEDWEAVAVPAFSGIRVLGYSFSPLSHTLKDFLSANLVSYQWLDVNESTEAKNMASLNNIDKTEFPVIFFEDGQFLKNPALKDIASKIGLNTSASSELYDLVIIGAGPAGLAAGVYGASEGLKTLLIEKKAPGGQAGTSSRIENYLGFPTGLSGADLARRAITQVTRFGTEFLSPQEVTSITYQSPYKKINLADDSVIFSKSVIIATGVDYRRLETKGVEQFTGAGVYYGAANTEAAACKNEDVYIVGGGNSAGQAAMYLSKFSKKVGIIIRAKDLTSTMSAYLIEQIDHTPNIELLAETEITEALGQDKLECLTIINNATKEVKTVPARALFIFIGAKPFTDWLPSQIMKDEKGFVLTGKDLANQPDFVKKWRHKQSPYLLETSIRGIFAAGDVRANAMNRVASAVGEGSMAVSFVHKYLAEI